LGSGAPSVRPRAGCPSRLRGVRLDRVESPVARLWLDRHRALLAESVGCRLGSVLDRLSPTGPSTAASSPRSLEEALDWGLRAGHRCPTFGPFRWWPSAPTLFLQGPASIASCPRSSVVVALSPRCGRLQGLAPPTSPCPAATLKSSRDQFLPWVCLPFEALPPLPWVSSVSRGSDPATGLRRWPRSPFGGSATDGRVRLSGCGSCDRRRSRPPWGSRRQRATVANLGFAAVSRRWWLSPLRRS